MIIISQDGKFAVNTRHCESFGVYRDAAGSRHYGIQAIQNNNCITLATYYSERAAVKALEYIMGAIGDGVKVYKIVITDENYGCPFDESGNNHIDTVHQYKYWVRYSNDDEDS